MDKQLIKEYIDNQPIKIVNKLDLDKEKLEYDKINVMVCSRIHNRAGENAESEVSVYESSCSQRH